MAKVPIRKTVLNKTEFDKSVDRSFKSFVTVQDVEEVQTVDEFFKLYNKLYYEIPIDGDENSHEFLVKESSKLIKIEITNEELEPLLQEISDLRAQILQLNQAAVEREEEFSNLERDNGNN